VPYLTGSQAIERGLARPAEHLWRKDHPVAKLSAFQLRDHVARSEEAGNRHRLTKEVIDDGDNI
jgi:hypothetical protein